jgi:hypothetical protein
MDPGAIENVLVTNKLSQNIWSSYYKLMRSQSWRRWMAFWCYFGAVEAEVQARGSGESRRPREQATAAALSTTAQSCCYCHQDHSSNTCKTVVVVSSRRQTLRRAGQYFVCLHKGHLAHDCSSAGKCYDYKDDITSLYSQPSLDHQYELTLEDQAPTSLPRWIQRLQSTHHRTQLLLMRPSVLCGPSPTRKCCSRQHKYQCSRPDTVKVFVAMDTGSQRSYLTTRIKNLLSLTLIGTQKLSIMTIGAALQSPGKHDFIPVRENVSHNVHCAKHLWAYSRETNYAFSGGLRTGTPISEHDFSCNFTSSISRRQHDVDKNVPL